LSTEVRDAYEVPDGLGLSESYKICVEIMDEIFNDNLEFHIIQPTPKPMQVWKVKVDKSNANVLMNSLRVSNLGASPKQIAKDASLGRLVPLRSSIESLNMASPPNASENAYALVPFKPKTKKEKLVESNKEMYATMRKGAKPTAASRGPRRLPLSMQMKILEASPDDQPVMVEIAQILNEMITKIEHGDDQ
jgi:hypothetical protein